MAKSINSEWWDWLWSQLGKSSSPRSSVPGVPREEYAMMNEKQKLALVKFDLPAGKAWWEEQIDIARHGSEHGMSVNDIR